MQPWPLSPRTRAISLSRAKHPKTRSVGSSGCGMRSIHLSNLLAAQPKRKKTPTSFTRFASLSSQQPPPPVHRGRRQTNRLDRWAATRPSPPAPWRSASRSRRAWWRRRVWKLVPVRPDRILYTERAQESFGGGRRAFDHCRLLTRGGISSMMGTVTLAILALGFGEALQKVGVLLLSRDSPYSIRAAVVESILSAR